MIEKRFGRDGKEVIPQEWEFGRELTQPIWDLIEDYKQLAFPCDDLRGLRRSERILQAATRVVSQIEKRLK